MGLLLTRQCIPTLGQEVLRRLTGRRLAHPTLAILLPTPTCTHRTPECLVKTALTHTLRATLKKDNTGHRLPAHLVATTTLPNKAITLTTAASSSRLLSSKLLSSPTLLLRRRGRRLCSLVRTLQVLPMSRRFNTMPRGPILTDQDMTAASVARTRKSAVTASISEAATERPRVTNAP